MSLICLKDLSLSFTYTLKCDLKKASQVTQSPRNVPFFLLISLLDEYSFANVHVKRIVEFKHLKKM